MPLSQQPDVHGTDPAYRTAAYKKLKSESERLWQIKYPYGGTSHLEAGQLRRVRTAKSNFNFPIHIHSEYELNYIIGARGARRIVGDHVADIGDREMVLITGSNLEHAWMDGNLAPGAEIYEVTIQFSPELFQGSGLIDRKQFAPIKKMLQDAQHGTHFPKRRSCKANPGFTS